MNDFEHIMVMQSTLLAAEISLEIPIFFSESEEDISSSDEETLFIVMAKRKKKDKVQRIENYVEVTVPGYTQQQFQQHFRMTIDAYEELLRVIGPELQRQAETGRPTINIEKQVLAVIWLLATPDSYRSVAEKFDLGKSSLHACFLRIIRALNRLAPRIIKWPREQELENVKQKFVRMAGLNNVVGAIDGTFIPIKAPPEDPQSYVTRKCNYAMTLQGICDSNLKFTDVFVGFPGSVSDTRIFRNSDIYFQIRNNIAHYFPNNEYIIGDKAYPVLTWCIPPYINRGNLTQANRHFNLVLARTRQTVERSFALLFGRFRRLKFLDMTRHDLIPATILATCVLHNICLSQADLLIEDYINDGMENVMHNEEEDNVGNMAMGGEEGRMRREDICRSLFRNRNL